VLEAAVESDADYIMSGDRHLLDMREYAGIRIVKPAEILKLL
jgi:predicted nucleic acid-binding protein